MDRLLRDAGGELTLSSYDTTGALADIDGTNAPTVVVTDSGGTVVAGFTPSRTGTGAYKAILPANLETLDTYEVAWSWANGQSRPTEFEVVGGFIFTVAELRAFFADFANATNYPTAVIQEVRSEVEDVIESHMNRAWRPKGRRITVDGQGDVIMLPDFDAYRLVSGSVDGVALTSTEITDATFLSGGLLDLSRWGTVSVLYEYGERATPRVIVRAALKYAKALLLEGNLRSDLATASRWSTADLAIERADTMPTGLPDADQVLNGKLSRAGLAVG